MIIILEIRQILMSFQFLLLRRLDFTIVSNDDVQLFVVKPTLSGKTFVIQSNEVLTKSRFLALLCSSTCNFKSYF